MTRTRLDSALWEADRHKEGKKLVPSRIQHRTGKPVVPQHPFDVEAFHSDSTLAIAQFGCNLVMLIAAGISNTGMKVSDPYKSFFFENDLLSFCGSSCRSLP